MNVLTELKRRNVFRMAGLYVVGAWLIIQIAETLLPIFHTPDWVLQTLVVLLAIGFLPALVFSWVFELTPEGIKRDAELDSAQSSAPRTARRMDLLTLAGVLLVVMVIAADRFWPSDSIEPMQSSAVPSDLVALTSNSIAVLPFVNMSSDANNAYFADGISEELLNVLARVDGLTVASRTSAFSFKGKDTPIPEIARLLDVRHVLEGSVRKQGNRVRITAQLIRAGTDKHLWSQTFDRELTDIFKVQEEIAQAITAELMGVLAVDGVSVTPSTSNLEAYERFLSGRARFFQRTELPIAITDLQYAVDNDPTLAEAWIYLAASYFVIDGYEAVDTAESVQAASEALEKAAELAPQHPMVLALQARQANYKGNQTQGQAQLERAAAIRSPDSTPVLWLGISLLLTGYIDEAQTVLERAQKMDPLSGINNGYLGVAQLALGDDENGEAAVQRAAAMGWMPGLMDHFYDLVARGERERAAALLNSNKNLFGDGEALTSFLIAAADPENDKAIITRMGETPSLSALFAFGNRDQMLDVWLARSEERDGANADWFQMRPVWLPAGKALREDPRLFKIAERRGVVDLWETRGYPPGCSRVRDPKGDHLDCSGMRP